VSALRFVLGDQLTRSVAALADIDAKRDVVLMVEVWGEATYVRHHKQKIAFLFSAMRHFAEELRAEGLNVDYVKLDDPGNTGSFTGELTRAVARHGATRVIVTEPGEWRVLTAMRGWEAALRLPVEIREDRRFFADHARFHAYARGRKTLRMEYFYREMRREHGYLMDGKEPAGGQFNFDHDNRKPLPVDRSVPRRTRFPPDATTRAVLALVAERFGDHFGDLEPFGWAVTRTDALAALDDFLTSCLRHFGDYQDAMSTGEPFLYHSMISPYLNAGLLTAREVCDKAEAAWRAGVAPLNAVEGFIRQVLGWREYVRGIYWLKMPEYEVSNALQAARDLPWLYWTGETDMRCMSEAIGATKRHAYAHHIQRLMVTGNFALLAGIEPRQVEEWYLVVYADAYQWVELPNVHGMVLFADGGLLASKPYAASGAYIDRMSNHCERCNYDPKLKSGPGACPFNPLYWNFLIENEARLASNPRMAMPYRTLARFSAERRAEIVREATTFLASLPTRPAAADGPNDGGRATVLR
jgi:deoxyribodipyrimidine photolyase-related protein